MQSPNTSKILQTLDRLKPELQPLPAHFAATQDTHTREQYATVLAAVLLAKGQIHESESRLFGMLTSSLGLEGSSAKYFSQANELDGDSLRNFFRTINSDDLKSAFLTDALILSRVHLPMSSHQSQLISEIIDAFRLDTAMMESVSLITTTVLGLPTDYQNLKNLPSIKISFTPSNKTNFIQVVASLKFQLGDYVKKGDFLVSLEYKSTLKSSRGFYGRTAKEITELEKNANADQGKLLAGKVLNNGILVGYEISQGSLLTNKKEIIGSVFLQPNYSSVW